MPKQLTRKREAMVRTKSMRKKGVSKRTIEEGTRAIEAIATLKGTGEVVSKSLLSTASKLLKLVARDLAGKSKPTKAMLSQTLKELQGSDARILSIWSKPSLAKAILVWIKRASVLKDAENQTSLYLKLEKSGSKGQFLTASSFFATDDGPDANSEDSQTSVEDSDSETEEPPARSSSKRRTPRPRRNHRIRYQRLKTIPLI